MPNYCFNEIKVYGNSNELTKFKDDVANDYAVFSFLKIKPVPKDIKNFEKWAEENWTANRWPLYANLTDKQDYLFYEVATAWVPPVGIFNALFDKYPTHDFKIYCYEEFNHFNYEVDFINGKVRKNIRIDWKIVHDNNHSKVLAIERDFIKETKRIVEEELEDNDNGMMQLPGLVFTKPSG